jgi:hypothetical protein
MGDEGWLTADGSDVGYLIFFLVIYIIGIYGSIKQ